MMFGELPHGWRIDRPEPPEHSPYLPVHFDIYEPDGPTWADGEPRPTLTVELQTGHERYSAPAPPEVSWPSTSDRRPALARALAVALTMAANEAEGEES